MLFDTIPVMYINLDSRPDRKEHVKKEFKRFVDWHRNRLSNSYQIPFDDIPDYLDNFDTASDYIKDSMKEYAMYNELPWEYCLLNEDEMWAVCVEELITGKDLNPKLKKMVLNSL